MNLISFDEASRIVLDSISVRGVTSKIQAKEAVGFASACEIRATVPNPRFDNSAVDGYLLRSATEAGKGTKLRVAFSIPAGSSIVRELRVGECAKIFTGAMIPNDCYAVVMQEDVVLEQDEVTLQTDVRENANIRRAGTDIADGDKLLQPGDVITAEALALISSQGLTAVEVYPKPRVALLATGNELKLPGEPLDCAEIYETNLTMLRAMVETTFKIEPTTEMCKDDPVEIENRIADLAEQHDILVISGGASVGDHDLVPHAIKALGQTFFRGVSLRPGKPMLFGKVKNCFVFGLPGNPASSFVGFLLFVVPAIKKFSGWRRAELEWFDVRFGLAAEAYPRDDFLRCKLTPDGIATPVGHQGSFGLRSLAAADCLVRLPRDQATSPGDIRSAIRI